MQRIRAVTSIRVISVLPQQSRLGNLHGGLDLVEVSSPILFSSLCRAGPDDG